MSSRRERADPASVHIGRKDQTVADVHVYINRPPGKEDTNLEDIQEAIETLDHVSGVEINAPGNVVAVSYAGGKTQQEEIKAAIEGAGYEVSRLSVRGDFPKEGGLWDI